MVPSASWKICVSRLGPALAAALAVAGCATPERAPQAEAASKVPAAVAQYDAARQQAQTAQQGFEMQTGGGPGAPAAMQVAFAQPVAGEVSSRRGSLPFASQLVPESSRRTDFSASGTSKSPAGGSGPDATSKASPASFQSEPPPPAPELLPGAEGAPVPPWEDPMQQPRDIDLSAALSIASGQNPQIQFALARIQESYAQYDAARALWLPSIRLGTSYNRHDGRYQNTAGDVIDINRSSFQSGLGVGAVGAGTQAFPGALANFRFTDAVFQPRIAQRRLSASQFAASAATNETLLDVALAYLELLRAGQQRAIALETRDNIRELAKLTQSFADRGQGPQADADRAQAELAVRENEVQRASEAIETSSAALALQLSADPSVRLLPREQTVVPIELVSWQVPPRDLVATGLSNRPELAESQSLVAAAMAELKRERFASLLPSVLLGFSYAGFGGGLGTAGGTNNFGNRIDYDAIAYWEVRNLGFGERAARDSARARTQQAQWRQMRQLDQVATDVTSAHAQVRSRASQIATAQKGVEKALDSYRRNRQRIHDGVGLPIEVLQSIQALDLARREYLRTVIDYNVAQFRLHWALGWP